MARLLSLSIRKKLIMAFVIILLVPSFTIAWLSYQSAKATLTDSMRQNAATNVDLLNQLINRFVDPEIKDAQYLAQLAKAEDFHGKTAPAVKQEVDRFQKLHPEVMNTYVASSTGVMILAPDQKLPDGYDPRTRPWYQEAMKDPSHVIITDPYVDAANGTMEVTIAQATADGFGVVGLDVDLKQLSDITGAIKIGKQGYAAILDKSQKVLIHPSLKGGDAAKGSWVSPMYAQDKGDFSYTENGKPVDLFFAKNELTGWKIAGTLYMDEVTQEANAIFVRTSIVVASALLVGGLLIYFIIRSIVVPLRRLLQAAETISAGDLTAKVQVNGRDELGQLAASFTKMSDSLRHVLSEVNDASQQLAASSQELMASAEQTAQATEHIAVTVQELAAGTDRQVQSVEESSRAIGDMSDGVRQIASSAQHVSETSLRTAEMAETGNESIQSAVQQMHAISETVHNLAGTVQSLGQRSQQIGAIIEVITSIAQQTNLLALNAAIEAARAGEHGRGFSVVADEVRKLAEQSSNSAQQIAELIVATQAETEQAVHAMQAGVNEVQAGISAVNGAGHTFEEIRDAVGSVTYQIQEVSAAAMQLSAGTQQVVQSIQHIADVAEQSSDGTQNVSAASQQQLASMEEISASAAALSKMAEDLHDVLQRFTL